jgi:hypothetical protein
LHIGRSVGSAAARVREHTTAAAERRDELASFIQSLRPRQRAMFAVLRGRALSRSFSSGGSRLRRPRHAARGLLEGYLDELGHFGRNGRIGCHLAWDRPIRGGRRPAAEVAPRAESFPPCSTSKRWRADRRGAQPHSRKSWSNKARPAAKETAASRLIRHISERGPNY